MFTQICKKADVLFFVRPLSLLLWSSSYTFARLVFRRYLHCVNKVTSDWLSKNSREEKRFESADDTEAQ